MLDFIICLSFCKQITVAYQRTGEPFRCSFKNTLKLTKDAKQLADITYSALENVKRHDFFEVLSPQSILLIPSFSGTKSGNCNIVNDDDQHDLRVLYTFRIFIY